MQEGKPHTWQDEDTYWQSNYKTRPYSSNSANYDQWRGGYRYGYEAANRYSGKNWNDVEPELSRNWNT